MHTDLQMSLIERTIQLSFQQRVFFTRNVFGVLNPMLRDILEEDALPKVLVVLDESLHQAQPDLSPNIESYFRHHSEVADLVCPPMILEGGERVKNSYFHVSEIQSRMDRFNIDRHSYVFGLRLEIHRDLAPSFRDRNEQVGRRARR